MFSKQQYGIYNRMVTFLSISQAGTTLATYSIISVYSLRPEIQGIQWFKICPQI
jgi:hypothetical protein